jgi:hypothetical protein
MNITNTMCRLSELTERQKQSLVYAMPESDYFDFSINEPFIGFNENKNSGTFLQEANPKIVTYTEMMQLLGKTMQFTKSDLKTGMFVKYRNGEYRMVLGNIITGDGWMSLNELSSNLLENINGANKLDVMSVYTAKHNSTIINYLKGKELTLIWERTEQTPVQKEMEELQEKITKLQEQAKVLQSKL